MNMEALIRDGVSQVRAAFLDKEISQLEKAKLGTQLVCKYMPNKLEGNVDIAGISIKFVDGTKVKM